MKRMRVKVKDVSGKPENKLFEPPEMNLILFHWSPTRNRSSINKYGLRTHQRTLQGLGWKPPYVCFSEDPQLAWHLSGRYFPEIKWWDLWMCNADFQTSFDGYEMITDTFPDTGRHYVKEYRIYQRVYKRDLYYLATRSN